MVKYRYLKELYSDKDWNPYGWNPQENKRDKAHYEKSVCMLLKSGT